MERVTLEIEAERDMAEAYYKTLETHLREHGCAHDFSEVANENGRLGAAPSLTEAWERVMAALPEGYAVMLRGSSNWAGRGPVWKVSAYHSDGRRKAWNAEGPTPTAALLALAERLEALR